MAARAPRALCRPGRWFSPATLESPAPAGQQRRLNPYSQIPGPFSRRRDCDRRIRSRRWQDPVYRPPVPAPAPTSLSEGSAKPAEPFGPVPGGPSSFVAHNRVPTPASHGAAAVSLEPVVALSFEQAERPVASQMLPIIAREYEFTDCLSKRCASASGGCGNLAQKLRSSSGIPGPGPAESQPPTDAKVRQHIRSNRAAA